MTREQYDQHKRRLEDQLQAGIQLLESAYQAQIRALDLVWMLHAEAGAGVPMAANALPSPTPQVSAAPQPTPPPKSPPPRRRSPGEVADDILAALPRLPELFTRGDVCVAIGYQPDRAVLYRLLQELRQDGIIEQESAGSGQRASVYRRTGTSHSPEPA